MSLVVMLAAVLLVQEVGGIRYGATAPVLSHEGRTANSGGTNTVTDTPPAPLAPLAPLHFVDTEMWLGAEYTPAAAPANGLFW
jgi:hypothetical protein